MIMGASQTGDDSPLVEVRDLTVTFPARSRHPAFTALNGVTFDIARGETLGLVGQSGSGKTTTGRAVLQLQKISRGSVKLHGRELTAMRADELRRMRRHMQFVLQNPYSSLHPRMTIAQTLTEPLIVHQAVTPARYRERVAELLELVSMDPAIMDRYPHEFSGGQRQRIVIARALAVNPDFVVCDEPVSALDVRTQAQIVSLLHSLQEKLKLSYLFIAHDLAIVHEVCRKVAVMYRGEIVEKGSVSQVYDNPTHPYTQMLFDSAPVLDPSLQRQRLRMPPPEPATLAAGHPDSACAFGEIHAVSSTPAWHEVAPGHGVSCRYRPA
ncbi:oligopeptide/dipeptide ABC transporter ATP-binding protein [Microvirga puerhi]|uniref:ATP-binding cassette domain-containing protein n=1 Tax=Microvirga puerhi TaxID=2876078 RepID=A0ABS7VIB2_9HYPH|nr:oligopeptide/dipeptide ABC transporter ATP-binding protein [Microvirga puerhi]MBZ6074896.1 ATP-binding cassette domain-containing protein [Microvirga puerhi]